MMTTSILLLAALLAPVSQDAPAGSGGDQSTTSRAEFQELAQSGMRAYNSNDSAALAGMYEERAQYICAYEATKRIHYGEGHP
jgi:hypothetical protein